LQLSGLLQFAVRQGAETEGFMTSAERVAAYAKVPVEALPSPSDVKLGADWPSQGVVEVRLVTHGLHSVH
jgi:hypothetical protein